MIAIRRKHSASRFGRSAFTVVEVLVVITVLGVLLALILPAVQRARESSRRVACANHLKNVATAILSETVTDQRFPASGHWGENTSGAVVEYHNWVVSILPHLDQGNLFAAWNRQLPRNDPHNSQLAQTHVEVLLCPSDITNVSGGGLSYVVNGGFGWTTIHESAEDCPVGADKTPLDLNGNGEICDDDSATSGMLTDRQIFEMTGLFFLENWKATDAQPRLDRFTQRSHRPDSVHDGTTNTLMVTENVRVGYDPNDPHSNWSSSQALRNSFFLSPTICRDATCVAGNVDYRRANAGAHRINASLTLAEGEAPWPSSYHPGGINAAFADGSVRFLNESIDGGVYAALVSPQGSRLKGPLAQPVLSDGDF
ncbi:MAG: DUF1559 domain-containing protein [Planctomycetaceae bacterium]